MGTLLEGRIKRLEARAAEAAKLAEEAWQQREWAEALGRLSDQDLYALGDVLTAAEERVEDHGPLVNLYEFADDERSVRALRALERAVADLRSTPQRSFRGGKGE